MVELACGLKRAGHNVEMFVYYPQYDFFRSKLSAHSIFIHEHEKKKGFSIRVVQTLVSLIRERKHDIIISFLHWPNIYSEISRMMTSSTRLIVSERTSHIDDKSQIAALFRRNLHRCANHVVTNSHDHKSWLEANHSWLRGKVTAIYNGLNINEYESSPLLLTNHKEMKLIAVGRIGPEKNVMGLLMAMDIFYKANGWSPTVSWVGRRDDSNDGKQYCDWIDNWLDNNENINEHWHWLGERTDITNLLDEHHALIHPSLYEGLPNVVCEALAMARPVLVSDVCDHAKLVADGKRGFLFDPNDPVTIADAINRLAKLGNHEWNMFTRNAREYAKSMLTTDRMISEYETLFLKLISNKLS